VEEARHVMSCQGRAETESDCQMTELGAEIADLYSKKLSQTCLVEIAHWGLAIWPDPFGMLPAQIVVNLLLKLGHGMNRMADDNGLGRNSRRDNHKGSTNGSANLFRKKLRKLLRRRLAFLTVTNTGCEAMPLVTTSSLVAFSEKTEVSEAERMGHIARGGMNFQC